MTNNSGGEIGAAPSWAAGTLASDWKADGSSANTTANYANALLPLRPQQRRSLQASTRRCSPRPTPTAGTRRLPAGEPSIIVDASTGANRLIDAAANGTAFLLHRGNDSASGNNDQVFSDTGGTTANLGLGWAQPIPQDVQIYLDTTGANWTSTFYVRSTASSGNAFIDSATYTYVGTRPINKIAMNQGAGTTGKISNLQLQNVSVLNQDADFDWTTPANWNGGTPNGVDAEADLLTISASRIATIASAVTAGTIRFDGAALTLAPRSMRRPTRITTP